MLQLRSPCKRRLCLRGQHPHPHRGHQSLSQRTSQPQQRPPSMTHLLQRQWSCRETMELPRDNSVGQARWFVQYIWGLRARFRFALRNPMRKPLVTWQQGDRICRSHFVSRSEERAALILDTLNPESRPLVESSSHPRIPPPRPLPPPDADPPTLTQIDRHNSDRQHIRSLRPFVEADHTGGQSKYSLLPPLPVPHRITPPALCRTSINSSGRRSVSAPVPLRDNAIPPRTSLLHPPPPRQTSLLPTATVADNQHTLRYSLLPHVHVALSPGVAQSASPQPSAVSVKRDGQYRSRWSLLRDMPPAKYRKTMVPTMQLMW